MSVFGSLMNKILGHSARVSEAKVNAARPNAPAAPAPTAAPAPAPPTTAAAPKAVSMATIEAALEDMASSSKQKLDWRNSIVDLMKLVGIDSDITNRRALAHELGYTGDLNDSATMNVWLHKEVMRRMAESGGEVPANLRD
jgi:3-oxoacyl-ACP reductase-like protein